jgi:hypothetical protein
MIDDDNNKKTHSNNDKAAQAYKLFSEGKKPVQVAIELNLREGQVNEFSSKEKKHLNFSASTGNIMIFLLFWLI